MERDGKVKLNRFRRRSLCLNEDKIQRRKSGLPVYNYVIHTAPIKDEQEDYYHWHLQITPRLMTPAGFEMGSGIYINVSFPEETAQFLREG